MKGTVRDINGDPVKGAQVFLYTTSDVKRQADFISPLTDATGAYRILLPAGKYWTIARLKKAEGYGPLTSGDKHSGEPTETDLLPHAESVVDFTVADLRESAQFRNRKPGEYLKVAGKIIDENGRPVRSAYVIVHHGKTVEAFPDYISAWTDEDGAFALWLPAGRYWFGAATIFPTKGDLTLEQEAVIGGDRADFEVVLKGTGADKK